VRKMYLSIDPIVTARSSPANRTCRERPIPEPGSPLVAQPFLQPVHSLSTIPLIRQQNGCAMAPWIYG
jgi:hypothetical protein